MDQGLMNFKYPLTFEYAAYVLKHKNISVRQPYCNKETGLLTGNPIFFGIVSVNSIGSPINKKRIVYMLINRCEYDGI